MSPLDLVVIDPRARAAWPWLPTKAAISSVWVSVTGDVVRVLTSGCVVPVLPGGYPRPGVAAHPCALER